jgi:hypothetical protein
MASVYKHYFVVLLAVVILAKASVSFFVQLEYDSDGQRLTNLRWTWKKNFAAQVPPDDYGIAQTALYYLSGKGYLTEDTYGLMGSKVGVRLTGFRPKFNVWLHVGSIRLYNQIHPQASVRQAQEMMVGNPAVSSYMQWFGFWATVLQIVFYTLSVFCFLQILRVFLSEGHAKICTLLYAVYPSVFIFMEGTVSEKIAAPMVVIFVYGFLIALQKKLSVVSVVLLAALATFACLLRPHVLFVWIVLLAVYIAVALYFYFKAKQRYKTDELMVTLVAFMTVAHLPVLYVHYKDFGRPFLSSETGLGLFFGHNWYARGSWYPGIWQAHGEELRQKFDADPVKIRFKDEKEELDFYGRQAWKFVRENPLKELELIARKTAIYLLPYNFMNHRVNLLLVFTHLGTIGFMLFSLRNRAATVLKNPVQTMQYTAILAPIIACYLLTLIFFVGERWRFYAEPFMLLAAYLFYLDFYEKFVKRSTKQTVA